MMWEHCYASLADSSVSLSRFGHSAVATTDANGNCQVVVYGGVGCHAGDPTQTALGDVVVLQVDSGTCSAPDILPGSSPGPRAFHSAVVTAAGRMLVFGGHILTFDAEHNRKRRNFFNDVWQLDLADWQWSKLPAGNSSSSGSSSGGSSSSSCAPARRDMAALLCLDDSRLLLFGGRSEQGKALQDTWSLDLGSDTWQQLRPVGAQPPPRRMHTLAKVGSQVVLFGGESDSGPLDDVWLLGGWGHGETLRWTQLRLRTSPAPRFGHAAAVCVPPAAAKSTPGSGRSGRRSSSTGSISASAAAAAQEGDAETSALKAADAANGTSGGPDGGVLSPQVSEQQQQRQQQQQHMVVFGGCLDISSFLSLNKNYVQSKDTWVLQLDQLMWSQLPQPAAATAAAAGATGAATAAAGAGASWPCERMCHSLTALPDGRLLVIGGRNKEGICRDMWALDMAGGVLPESSSGLQQQGSGVFPPPASPRPSTAGSTGSAAGKQSPNRPAGSQSLLQSLLGPVRARVPSQQALLGLRDGSGSTTPLAASQQGPTPPGSQPASPGKRSSQQQQQQQQQQDDDRLAPLEDSPARASFSQQQMQQQGLGSFGVQASPANQQQQQQQQGAALAAAAAAASDQGGLAASQQPVSLQTDSAGGGQFTKLLRNPAAYSAGAINRLGGSLTSTVTSLLAGRDGQPGPMLPRLPEALMRVAPSWGPTAAFGGRGSSANSSGSSTEQQQQQQGIHSPGLAPLRQQMHLLHAAAAGDDGAQARQELRAPTHVLQELAVLGQQLLLEADRAPWPQQQHQRQHQQQQLATTASGSFAANSSIPTDVLVSAARQHLMSAEVLQLRLPQVALLLADYQQLAASYYAHAMLSRLSDGFPAAAAAAGASQAVEGTGQCGSAFLQRQPAELLLHQVQQLQRQYQQLLMQATP